MYKFLILTGVNLCFFYFGSAQNKTLIKLQAPLIKYMEFKDTILSEDKKIYKKCQKWALSKNDVYKLFSLAKQIKSEEKSQLYYWLPCFYKSTVLYKNDLYTIEINAASFITLYNSKTTLYFGCSCDLCLKYFILAGGNASE